MTKRVQVAWYAALGGVLSRAHWVVARRIQDPARHRAFRALWASQWWSDERLRQQQWTDLKGLLTHAYQNVPYYREVFRSLGAHPEDFRETSDIARLPLLTKAVIQDQGRRLRMADAIAPPGVYVNHTGGSTGTPLTFYQDGNYRAWGMAELDRNFWMCGYRPGWRQAFFWGSDYDSKAHTSLGGRLHDLILNLRWVNTFALDEDRLRSAAQELSRFRPQLIVGYVSSLTMLAQLVRDERLELTPPKAIQTSAEALTAGARELIEGTLGARCFDRYGCREVGNIAHECDAHAGLHLLAENNYTEFVDGEGKPARLGEAGQIVVTNVRNYAMPFIRYATGDVGTPGRGACPCGRGLPLMTQVTGRVSDIIATPSGRLLHGEFFTHLFYGAVGVRQFQVEQVTLHDLVVRIVAVSDEAYEAVTQRVGALIHDHGDKNFRLRFERVSHIPTAQSGKYRFTLSRVSPSARGLSNAVAG